MTSQRFLACYRLRSGAQFRRAYEEKCSASDAVLLVYATSNEFDYPRIGLSVSRKVGGAVQRNRWKRLLREAFRLSREELPPGIDLVVIPRPGIEPELRSIRQSLTRLARRAAEKLQRRPPKT